LPIGLEKNSVGFADMTGKDLLVSGGTDAIITTTASVNKFQRMKTMHEALKKKRRESSSKLVPAVDLLADE